MPNTRLGHDTHPIRTKDVQTQKLQNRIQSTANNGQTTTAQPKSRTIAGKVTDGIFAGKRILCERNNQYSENDSFSPKYL